MKTILTDEQKAALDESIEHYRKAVNDRSVKLGVDHCACCRRWWRRGEYNPQTKAMEVNCDGCPIKAHTGQNCCLGTPFYPWENTDLEDIRGFVNSWSDSTYFDLVEDELNFLIDLRNEQDI